LHLTHITDGRDLAVLGDGVAPAPIVLFTLTTLTWLNRWNASTITSTR
jgi:hypothetical protein